MAISHIRTHVPLDTYSQVMAIPGWLFNQITHPNRPKRGVCDSEWLQSGYLSDPNRIAGRDDVARAMATAERMLAEHCRFFVGPGWVQAEPHPWVHPSYGRSDGTIRMHTNWGYLIAAGIEAWDEIEADVAIVYTASVAGEALDTATLTFNTAVTSVDEIAIVPPGRDPAAREWRIRPLDITISPAGLCTVVGPRWMFVDPNVWLNIVPVGLGSANFVATVDAYRHYNDISVQGQLRWIGDNCSIPACGQTCQAACVDVLDYRTGKFRARTAAYAAGAWSASSWAVTTSYPIDVKIWYYAGYRAYTTIDGWMPTSLQEAVIRLANVLMIENICGCGLTAGRFEKDREEMDINSLNIDLAQSAFGTTARGAVFAHSVVARIPPLGKGG